MKTSLVSLAIAGTFFISQFCQAEIKSLTLDSSQTKISYQSDYTPLSIESKTKIEQYGIAELKGKSLKERARALINISHHDFKEQLIYEWEKRFKTTF